MNHDATGQRKRISRRRVLAGRLAIDETGACGPQIAVDFDALMTMKFKAAR